MKTKNLYDVVWIAASLGIILTGLFGAMASYVFLAELLPLGGVLFLAYLIYNEIKRDRALEKEKLKRGHIHALILCAVLIIVGGIFQIPCFFSFFWFPIIGRLLIFGAVLPATFYLIAYFIINCVRR